MTDPVASVRFSAALDRALRGEVLGEDARFCCASGIGCRASVGSDGFAAGQLSYVGGHYAAESGGRPLRILVVSMQVGDDEAPVTMERRQEQIRARSVERFEDRNQHMAGVTTALRVLYGGEPGVDRDGEMLATPNGHAHVLDAYAMANSVLCSRRPGPGREGRPSSTMIESCGRHLRTTIEVLRPTVVHSQGRAAGWSTHQAVERIADKVQWLDDYVAHVEFGDVEAVWCSLRHPSRNWAQLGRTYLRDVAAPALRKTRAVAMGS